MNQSIDTQTNYCNSFYITSDILHRGNISRAHLYKLISKGQFPKPIVRVGNKFTRWSSQQVDAWFQDPQGWIEKNASKAGVCA
jgi:predicted DNA-binding transcriptional regulator AlpA